MEFAFVLLFTVIAQGQEVMVLHQAIRSVGSKCECAQTIQMGMVLVVRPYLLHFIL